MPQSTYNYKLGYLRAIAIILVVLGHANGGGFGLMGGWFPIYSFHIPLLIFVAGYFTKDFSSLVVYFKKRVTRLVVPYYIANAAYASIFLALASAGLLVWAYSVNFRSFVIDPWLSGQQYLFNLAAWFVLSLFLAQLIFVGLKQFMRRLHLTSEVGFFAVFMGVGLFVTYLASVTAIANNELLLVVTRALFMLPFLQLGVLYRTKLEKHDKLSWIRIAILFGVQLTLLLSYGTLTSQVLFMNFGGQVVLPFLVAFTGIYLCLQLATVLAKKLSPSRILRYIGDHSFSIMTNHLLGFWLLNALLFTVGVAGFDAAAWQSDIYYKFVFGGVPQTLMVYVAVGICFSLAVSFFTARTVAAIKPVRGWIVEKSKLLFA